MARRSDIDWDAVKRQYAEGALSLRALSDACKVSVSQIRLKAKREGWHRGERAEPARFVQLRKGGGVRASCENDRQDGYLYVFYVEANGERMYKIGIAKEPMSRRRAHQVSNPLELMVACCYYTPSAYSEESFLHDTFAGKHIRGEWFRLGSEDLRLIAARSLLV